MGTRSDKGRAVSHYLTTRTGIPGFRWDFPKGLVSPHPYDFLLATAGDLGKVAEAVAAMPTTGVPAVIRYDKHLESVDDAWAIFRLSVASQLIATHYEAHVLPRITEGE